MIGRGQPGKDIAEGGAIIRAHIGWDLHAGQYDLCIRVMSLYAVDDGLKVGTGTGKGDAAETVVCSQLKYEYGYGLT